MNIQKIQKHNSTYKYKYVDKYCRRHDDTIKLFPFQHEAVDNMVTNDQLIFKVYCNEKNVNMKQSLGVLALCSGMGKTFIICERIRRLFQDTSLFEGSYYYCLTLRQFKTFNNTRRSVLIIVPPLVFNQWIEHFVLFFGDSFVNENVYTANQNIFDDKHELFETIILPDLQQKTIIIAKSSQLPTILSWSDATWTALSLHMIFIDEAKKKYDTFLRQCRFTWLVSTDYFPPPQTEQLLGVSSQVPVVMSSFSFNLIEYLPVVVKYRKPILNTHIISNDVELSKILLCSENTSSIIAARLDNKLRLDTTSNLILSGGLSFLRYDELKRLLSDPVMFLFNIWKSKECGLHRAFINNTSQREESGDMDCCRKTRLLQKLILATTTLDLDLMIIHYCVANKENFNISQEFLSTCRANVCKVSVMKDRLVSDSCLVCLDETCMNKLLLVCCNQIICRSCILVYVSLQQNQPFYNEINCPHCKHPLADTVFNDLNQDVNSTFIYKYQKCMRKCERLYSKTLVIYDDCQYFREVLFYNLDSSLYDVLSSGSFSSIIFKKINIFRLDTMSKFLFINSKICSNGLNLHFADCCIFLNEFTQDRKQQILNCVQRFPRTTKLAVFFLVGK